MSKPQLIAVVIEWYGLRDAGPELIVAPDIEEATRQLVESIEDVHADLYGGLQMHDGTPADWHAQNPRPHARGGDLSDIERWLNIYHEYTNAPVWTMFRINPETLYVQDWLQPGWPDSRALTSVYDSTGKLVERAGESIASYKEREYRMMTAGTEGDRAAARKTCACAVLAVNGTCTSCGRVWRTDPAPFEVAAGAVATDNEPSCSTCGKTHRPDDAQHSEEM